MPSLEPKHTSTSVLADPALPSLPGDPDPTVLLHSLVQDEVQIEGFFARGLFLGLQQRPRTAHSQQPQAREQPAPRAPRPGRTCHHPVTRDQRLPSSHNPSGSGSATGLLRAKTRKRRSHWGLTPGSEAERGWDARSKLRATQQLPPRRESEVLGGQRESPRPPQLPPELWANPSGQSPVLPLRVPESCCRQ